jgi:hypothetical protein
MNVTLATQYQLMGGIVMAGKDGGVFVPHFGQRR